MFRLKMFVIALFTSDVGLKHVSCMVVQFMLFVLAFVIKFCGNILPNILLSTHRR